MVRRRLRQSGTPHLSLPVRFRRAHYRFHRFVGRPILFRVSHLEAQREVVSVSMPDHLSRESVVQLPYQYPVPNTFPSFQVSTVDSVAAFGGGIYVSLVSPELLFPIWLTSTGTHCREVRQRPNAENPCVGGPTISENMSTSPANNDNVQTWLGGNTLSDLIITVSMLYYVKSRHFNYRMSF